MKLRTSVDRGGRPPVLRAGEAVGRPEVAEPPHFAWMEVTQEKELIGQLFKVLNTSEAESGVHPAERHRERLRLAFFLEAICQRNPELPRLKSIDLQLIAEQRLGDPDFNSFTSNSDDYFTGKFSSQAREKVSSIVEQHFSTISETIYGKIWRLFSLAIGAPQLLKKFLALLTPELNQEMEELVGQSSSIPLEEVAMLILLFPERRGELLGLLTIEDVTHFNQKLNQQLDFTFHLDHETTVGEASYVAELLFFRQVLAAGDGQILPNGDIELMPPAKQIQQRAPLPERTMN